MSKVKSVSRSEILAEPGQVKRQKEVLEEVIEISNILGASLLTLKGKR